MSPPPREFGGSSDAAGEENRADNAINDPCMRHQRDGEVT
jgi:hypothetical protein